MDLAIRFESPRSQAMQSKNIFASSLLVAATFFLQQIPSHAQGASAQPANAQSDSNKPAQAPPDMSHMQHGMSHGGFMQGGMHHAVAKGVKIEQKIDGHTITVRVGPMSLPAH